jgi:UDP-N-acetyl-D-mannosaminuronic acid dehydrogenase
MDTIPYRRIHLYILYLYYFFGNMKVSSTIDSNQEQICLNTLSSPTTSYSTTKSNECEPSTIYNSDTQFNKVLIIGLGQLGLPVARYVSEKGFDTYGYDLSHQAIERAEKTAAVKKAVNFSEFDVYIMCVSTHKPNDMFSPQVDGLLSIAEKISLEAKNGALVSIESTIPKGTSKKIFEILDHRLHVVHAPHRWYSLEEKEHSVNQLRVIGGVCNCCLKAGMQFYGGAEVASAPISNRGLGIPMHPVSNVEIAETTKVVENAHRYLQIAFAEDLYLYCQANNINFSELRDALNTKWNVNILEPREGIGGHCLPKDTKMFLQSSTAFKSKLLTGAMEVDEDYRSYRQCKDNRIVSPSISTR